MKQIFMVIMGLLAVTALVGHISAQQGNKPERVGDKIIGEKGTQPVIREEKLGASIDAEGTVSLLGDVGLISILCEEGFVEIIGEKGSGEIIGEKGSGEIIGEKGSGKIIGEKGSGEIIGEKGRAVRGAKTGRTVWFLGRGAADVGRLKVGERLRLKACGGNSVPPAPSTPATFAVVEPELARACCAVVKISGGLVTAKDSASGEMFRFAVENPKVRSSIRVGHAVGKDAESKWAFLRSSATRGLKGQQATYSYPIQRGDGKR